MDLRSDQPVSTVAVELVQGDGGGRVLAAVVTREDGRFVLQAPSAGTYRIRASRLGYASAMTPAFDLSRESDALEVEVLMSVDAVPIAPLVVVSNRPVRLDNLRLESRGYIERRAHWGKEGMGFGHFLGREEIEQRAAFMVSDMLQLPGVRLVGLGGRRRGVRMRSVTRLDGSRCNPLVFVDGVVAGTGNEIDDFVAIGDVVGIEVYPGLTQPAQFDRGQLCGSVVLWTG